MDKHCVNLTNGEQTLTLAIDHCPSTRIVQVEVTTPHGNVGIITTFGELQLFSLALQDAIHEMQAQDRLCKRQPLSTNL